MSLAVGDKVTGLVRSEFFRGTVTKIWERGFVWQRDEETTQILSFLNSEGTMWMRGDATLADRQAMKAAVALRGSK